MCSGFEKVHQFIWRNIMKAKPDQRALEICKMRDKLSLGQQNGFDKQQKAILSISRKEKIDSNNNNHSIIRKNRPNMSQYTNFFPPQNQLSSYNSLFGGEFVQKNFVPVLPLSTYSNPIIKAQQKNQYIYNAIIPKKKQRQLKDSESPEYDLFEIQKKRKKQKYKRSTNNSHKKFISALRRLFYAVISIREKEEFETKYSKFRSCRTFFFIILAYMKFRFSPKLLNSVRVSFINQMKIKIQEYQQQINRTKNMNLKNFREEQIIDIKFSIKSCNEYFQGNTRQAIECMYKKDKSTVIKRQHYESALRSVHMIEKQLIQNPRTPLESPYVEDFSNSSDRQKIQRKVIKREIRIDQLNKLAQQKQEPLDMGFDFNYFDDCSERYKKDLRPTGIDEDPQSAQESSSEQQLQRREILYPPLLEAIPFIKYDPFLPPFRYKRQTKFRMDVREDFFGALGWGLPKFYQRDLGPLGINHQMPFQGDFPPRF